MVYALVASLLPTVADATFDGAWTAITPAGPLPIPRRDTGMIYDPVRDRVVAVGGEGRTWVLPLAAPTSWEKLPTSVYASPGFERAVYDAAADRMIMINSNMHVFQLSLASPTAWTGIGVVGISPPARTFFAVAHDVLRNRLLVYGGGPYTGIFSDIWALTLGENPTWSQIVPSGDGPGPAWGPMAVYDPGQDRLIVGMGAADVQYTVNANLFAVSLSSPVWQPFLPMGPGPSARMMTTTAFDPGLQRAILFGGARGDDNDTWALELEGTPAWAQLSPLGPTPPGRWSAAMAFRPGGPSSEPSILLYAGHDGGDFTDLWSLSSYTPTGPPTISSFVPAAGRVGDPVSILGLRLSDATEVRFNGTSAPILQALVSRLDTQVPPGATTGQITVTTPSGSATSVGSFFVGERPVISSAEPDSGRTGDTILLRGLHFTGATSVRLGGTGGAPFTVVGDDLIELVVDSLASTGPVSVTTPAATGTSDIVFTKLADDHRPRLLSVGDVGDDQGGRVMLRWRASDFDQPHYRLITGYRVWRRAPPDGATSAQPAIGGSGVRGRRFAFAGSSDFWESLVDLPAAFLSGYAYAAETLRDSTEAGNPYTAFFVQALTGDPFEFYNSSPDSGYSVDNLAPPLPIPFIAVYSQTGNALHWTPSRANDFREFRLHRGSGPAFVPGPTNLIVATGDTGYVDVPGAAHYKLATVDIHGNVGRYAMVSPGTPAAALASLVSVDARADRIRLVWYASDQTGARVTVYRREVGREWLEVSQIVADGTGYLSYEDASVTSRTRYGYRLGLVDEGQEVYAGEVWVDVPALHLALRGATPNPAVGGQLRVEFTLGSSGPARLELVDVSGRIVRAAEVSSLGTGTHSFAMPGNAPLRPGIYFLRLRQGGGEVRARVAVVD